MSCILSIIVPIYKVEDHIHKCIDSILEQTFKNFELILVDDGSPDKCGLICDDYAKKDSRIKVIHKENSGVSEARNIGIDMAQGEYIGFVDGDDYLERDMYETLYNAAQEYNADLVECAYTTVKGDKLQVVMHDEGIMVGDNLFALSALADCWFHCSSCNKIYKKILFSEIRFPVGKIHEEEAIMHRIFFSLKKYVYIGKSKYFYLQREGSIMNDSYTLKRLHRLEAYEDRFYFLKNNINEKSIINLAELSYFNEIISNYYELNRHKELDLDKVYRKSLKKLILNGYDEFLKNNLLAEYRLLISLSKLNQFVFDIAYNLYLILSDWYCKSIIVKKYISKRYS